MPNYVPLTQRRRLYYWAAICSVVFAVLLLVIVIAKHVLSNQRNVPAFVGGYCAILATALSIFLIMEHLTCFSVPECQAKIVRILFMVPIYALISFFSILFPAAAEYLNLVRDTYEAYALYNFFSLMLELMGGTDTLYRALMVEGRDPIKHFWPLSYCLDPLKITPRFVQHCRLCVFQFMACKPLITFVVLLLAAKGKMGEKLFDLSNGYFWTTVLYNISITIAFTALVYFYLGMKDFLEGKNALPKFLCIKAVIFLSFWQGVVIAILGAGNWLPRFDYWSEKEAPVELQDFLICVEMLLVAFAHKVCFGTDEYGVPGVDEPEDHDTVASQRYVAPLRLKARENLKYTLYHEDLIGEIHDIVRNR